MSEMWRDAPAVGSSVLEVPTKDSGLKTKDSAALPPPVEGRAECGKCVCVMKVWNGRGDWLFCVNFPGHEGELTHVSGTGVVLECRKFCRKREPVAVPAEAPTPESVRYISLGRGRTALVDAADFEWLNQRKWHAGGGAGYATGQIGGKHVFMHRLIMEPPPGKVVDHINGNIWDNRRDNLRNCTHTENARNKRKGHGTSRFKGVVRDARSGKWKAAIQCDGATIRLGLFDSEIDAAMAYDRKAIELFGEFAYLNFPRKNAAIGRGGTSRTRGRAVAVPHRQARACRCHPDRCGRGFRRQASGIRYLRSKVYALQSSRMGARVAKRAGANYHSRGFVLQGVMSTRTAAWIALIGVLVAATVAFFIVRARGLNARTSQVQPSTSQAGQVVRVENAAFEAVITDDGTAWPQFGADPGRSGRVPWTVPDQLSRIWRFKTGAEVKSSPAIVKGRVFVGSSDANVYSLDLRTGGKVWAYKTNGAVEAPPTVVGGAVYVGSTDGWLYALDANGGDLKWKYKTDAEIHGAANWTKDPNGEGTWILVGSYDSKVHCLDSRNGAVVWTFETGSYVNGSPAVADGACAFGGCDALIHVVALADGKKRSEIDTGSYIAASAAFVGGQIFVGNYENVFLRAEAASGQVGWKYTDSNAPFFSSPAVTSEAVIVGGRDGLVHAIGRDDGKRRWAFRTMGEVDSSPAVCGDKIVVGSSDGRIYVLRLADGEKLWSYDLGRAAVSSPAVAQGVVVVGCDDGYVYAFGTRKPVGGAAR